MEDRSDTVPDADGAVRVGRRLRPGVDPVWVSRGACAACGATWIGAASRRGYPGHETRRVALPCPSCRAPDQATLTLPELGGLEVRPLAGLSGPQRAWLGEEPVRAGEARAEAALVGIAVGLVLLAGLGAAVGSVGARVVVPLVGTLVAWVGFVGGFVHPRAEAFRARWPLVAWPLHLLGLAAVIGVFLALREVSAGSGR